LSRMTEPRSWNLATTKQVANTVIPA
jgi:hypothetical protein